MPHRAKKDPRACRGRKDMKHELTITKRSVPWQRDCGWSSYGVVGGGIKKWYNCIHQKSCKKCGKIVEWYLKNNEECPDFHRNVFRNHYRKLFDADLDGLPTEKE